MTKSISSAPADPAVRVQGLGKTFHAVDGAGQALQALKRIMAPWSDGEGRKRASEYVQVTRHSAVTALQDVTFDVPDGAIVAIDGPVGSGKSTLLKILAGALPPTEGRIEIRGTREAVLRIGSDLNPSHNLGENVSEFLRSSRRDIRHAPALRDAVAEMADLHDFVDLPLRHYSTGMAMRLGLALALAVEPDILLLDDVLEVGDLAVRERFKALLRERKRRGGTTIFASGDEAFVRELADDILDLVDSAARWRAPREDQASRPPPAPAAWSWQVTEFLPHGKFVAVAAVEPVRRDSPGGQMLRLELSIRVLAAQRLRPLLDVRNGALNLFRSLYPDWIDLDGPGDMRFGVDLPLDLLGQGRFAVDLTFVSKVGDGVHVLKCKAVVALDRVGGATEDGAVLRPRLEWLLAPVEVAPHG